MTQEILAGILERYESDQSAIIAILQDIQENYGYLPREVLTQVSGELNIPISRVMSLATFFKAFSLKPRGEHMIKVCVGTACHVRGAQPVLDEIKRQLGIEAGETTEDMQFTLETVNCLGACALGPIMVIDDEYYGEMSPGKVKAVINSYQKAVGNKRYDKIKVTS